ncbi:MAG: DUF2892 domain-containing protein [archaeon]
MKGILIIKQNIGFWDRAVRLILGILLLGNLGAKLAGIEILYLDAALATMIGFIGVILIVTAALGFCPLYEFIKRAFKK